MACSKAEKHFLTVEQIFQRLDAATIEAIVRLQLRSLEARLAERGLGLEVSAEAVAHLARVGYEPAFGARPVRRAIRSLLEDPMATQLISGLLVEGDTVDVQCEGDGDGARLVVGPLSMPSAEEEAA